MALVVVATTDNGNMCAELASQLLIEHAQRELGDLNAIRCVFAAVFLGLFFQHELNVEQLASIRVAVNLNVKMFIFIIKYS